MTSQQESNSVDRFVSLVQRRLNRHWAMRILWSAMTTGSVVLVLIALFYVIPGYQMPWYWYPIVAGSALVLGTVVWLFTKADTQSAAHFADQYFQMKDALRSHLNFRRSGKQDGFYQLQSEQANDGVQHRNVAAIRLRHPYKLTTLALVLLTVAVSLGFKSASPEVMERLAREEANVRNSQQVKKEMLELINELEKSLEDDLERDLVDPAKLRKWVSELTQTADHREALRQYAQLERKFNQAAMKLQQRKDEQLLNQASQELKKDENLQELADKLAQKKYDKAAADLEKMKNEKFDLDKLSQEKKDLAKLKAAAKRMA